MNEFRSFLGRLAHAWAIFWRLVFVGIVVLIFAAFMFPGTIGPTIRQIMKQAQGPPKPDPLVAGEAYEGWVSEFFSGRVEPTGHFHFAVEFSKDSRTVLVYKTPVMKDPIIGSPTYDMPTGELGPTFSSVSEYAFSFGAEQSLPAAVHANPDETYDDGYSLGRCDLFPFAIELVKVNGGVEEFVVVANNYPQYFLGRIKKLEPEAAVGEETQ